MQPVQIICARGRPFGGVFTQIANFAVEQLQMDVEGVERIPDLVRHAGSEQLNRIDPLRLTCRGLLLAFMRHITQNHQGTATVGGILVHRDHIERQKALYRIGDLNLARDQLRPLLGVQTQNAIPVHLPQVTRDRPTPLRIERETQKLLGGAVGVVEIALAADHQDALLDRLKDHFEQTAVLSQAKKMRLQAFRIQTIQPFDKLLNKS